VIVVWCQIEVSATGWSLVQRSPTDCGVSECDREASIMRRSRPPRGCRAIGKKNNAILWYRATCFDSKFLSGRNSCVIFLSFFLSYLFSLTCVYLLIVVVECYFCTWSHN
jgi:hypothetical protein